VGAAPFFPDRPRFIFVSARWGKVQEYKYEEIRESKEWREIESIGSMMHQNITIEDK
jgi:hypothetical protein